MGDQHPIVTVEKSASQMNPPGYLDLRALSVYASCSVRWLRARLVDRFNPLPFYRVSGKILVKRAEFDTWMDRHRVARPTSTLDQIVESVVADIRAGRTA